MYARTVGSEDLSFGVSGMLWRDNLVMYDRQTDSWWAQATGMAIHGPKTGASLTQLPSDMMEWKRWRATYPDTVVLVDSGGGNRPAQDRYASYHRGGSIGVTGRTRGGGALDAKARILGFRLDGGAFAMSLDAPGQGVVLSTQAAGQALVVVATPDRTAARVFLAGGHAFSEDGVEGDRTLMKDRATGSRWDGFDGRALSGPLAGLRLEPVTAHQSYWFSWYSFFPDTVVLVPARDQ